MTPLARAFRDQARSCAALGSPFMERLCTLLADMLQPDTPLTRRLFDWQGDLGPSGHSVPLRLCGALHALRLGGDATLDRVYPPAVPAEAELRTAIEATLQRHAAFIDRFIDSPPQTNEIRRSGALIAMGHWLAARHPMPMVFSELGASAGLNLLWDRIALDLGNTRRGPADAVLVLRPDWTGAPPPVANIRVAERAAVDLSPIDVSDPAQEQRLLAYLWPDQPHRLMMTRAAIAAHPPLPQKGDAVDWLETRLVPRPEHLHVIWSTVAWQYLPAESRERGQHLIEEAGARATANAPLAWFTYEADGQSPGAALTLRLWPGNLTIAMGRADFHGRWIDWQA
ncbi:MAG: DUF2332 family protein [Paracoccaceae bacterium]